MKKVLTYLLCLVIVIFLLKGADILLTRLSFNNETLCRFTQGHWVSEEDYQRKLKQRVGTLMPGGSQPGCYEYPGGDSGFPQERKEGGSVIGSIVARYIFKAAR